MLSWMQIVLFIVFTIAFFSSYCSSFISSTGVELVSTKFHTVAGSGVGVGVSEEQDSIIDFNNHWNISITFNNNNNCQLKFNLCIIYSLFINFEVHNLHTGVWCQICVVNGRALSERLFLPLTSWSVSWRARWCWVRANQLIFLGNA